MLDLGRFMLGVSMAVTGYAVSISLGFTIDTDHKLYIHLFFSTLCQIPVYLAEFTPKNHRGAFVILHTVYELKLLK